MDAIVYDKVGKEAEKVREALYGIYPQETITDAAIASFDDGADGIPVKALTVGIEPVQDLHGYGNPWPAGGGKNKCPPLASAVTHNGITFTPQSDGSVVCNGTASAFAFASLPSITLPAGTYMLTGASGWGSAENPIKRIIVLQNDNAIASNYGSGSTFTLSEEVTVNARIDFGSGAVADNIVAFPMIRLASEADATFAPYENICPISGWTGAEVTGCGKNLLNVDSIGKIKSTQSNTRNGIYITKPGTYTIKAHDSCPGVQLSARIKSKSGVYGSATIFVASGTPQPSVTYTIEDGDTLIIFDANPGNTLSTSKSMFLNTKVQLELGSTATDYEEYRGSQISVAFPSEAGDSGTVYGGMLTLNPDRTGTLVADKGLVDLGTLTWIKTNQGQFYSETNFGATNSTNILCSVFRYGQAYTGTEDNVIELRIGTYHRTWIRSTQYDNMTTSEFKSAMSGVQLVYPLASPRTFQLTAEQVSGVLSTLYGTNNIWANTGDIEKLTYHADLGKYIDSHITTAVANALNA